MPLLKHSTYRPPALFNNCHLQTCYPALFRKVRGVTYTRERITTPDGDFLDLDWSRQGAEKVIIAVHGLGGSSFSRYMPGILKAFNRRGWDGVAMNLRGCSGEPNQRLRFYHAGATDDLHTVVTHVMGVQRYRQIALIGFSLGGNLVLKYLGEEQFPHSPRMAHAVAVSAPCDLASSARKLARRENQLYMWNFLHDFQRQIRAKMPQFPDQLDDTNFHTIRTFKAYDDRYTAPLHGFANAEDYWERTSCRPYLPHIHIPTLILNAQDDPILDHTTYPTEEAQRHPCLFLEIPRYGGHLGFVTFRVDGEYWHETRVAQFILETRYL
jgi:predicted alpha/beta-fold hydrolase